MSSIIKVFLLLAVVVCISKAQLSDSGKQCLCQNVRRGISSKAEVKDIQIYPETIFCDRVEIVLTLNSGLRYCLNPELKAVKKLIAQIMKQNASTAAKQTVKPTSTNTASV